MNFKRILPHLVAVIGFAVLAVLYCSPVLKGKRLNQHDVIQSVAAGREVVEYHKQTGEWAWWTNSMFGGMPAYMIAGDYPTSLTHKLGQYINLLLPDPANYIWLMMVGGYILMLVLGANVWLSALGAIAYSFASYTLLSLEAGHVSKILALAYAPGILGGVIMALRGRFLAGAALTALFLGLELYANHVQITYYLAFGIIIYVLIESIAALRAGRIRELLLALSALAAAAVLAVGTHTTRLWNAADYVTVTNRGKTELTITPKAEPGAPAAVAGPTEGLDKEYAFRYSYGIGETFTLMIPNYAGGPSAGSLTTDSETYKKMTGIGIDPANAQQIIQNMPLYHGNLYSQSGPAYAGAIVIFLFVLGLLIVPGRLKWWALGISLLYIAWAWGKNFPAFNYAFFDYFPSFNKFRAVTMTLTLAQLPLVMLGIVALKLIADKKWTAAQLNRPLLISLGATAGLSLLMALAPTVFQGFQAPSDDMTLSNFEQGLQNKNLAEQVLAAIVSDRIGMVRSDAFRSAILILLVGGLIWLFVRDRIKAAIFYPVLLVLMIFDLFNVDKRYFNNDDFVSKQSVQETITPTAADEQILADKALDFRVLDMTTDFMSDAKASYFHKSLGGYHAAKMRSYQELAEFQIYRNLREAPGSPTYFNVINMLNTRYILTQAQPTSQQQAPGPPMAQLNPGALGNAWFVDDFRLVPNANAEMKALDSLNTRQSAIVDQRFAEQLNGLKIQRDSANSIRLTSYKPNELTYESNAKTEQLAVFSEIYYNIRNEWQVTLDGKEMPHMRANYVLRAMRVPAGKHTIVFKFDPVSIRVGKIVDLVCSLLIIAFIGTAVFIENRRKPVRS
jgi:hypothetical protein